MKLEEARRLARNLREAEQEFDASWAARWQAIVRAAVLAGLPLGGAAGLLAHFALPDPGALVVFLGTWVGTVAGVAASGPRLRRRAKRLQGMETMDARVLQACEQLEGIAPEVAPALERSLDAYLQITRTADDPVWARSGVAMRDSVRHAGEHLLALMDWGRRLSEVRRTVSRLADRPEGSEVRARYEAQLELLMAAAAAFEAVEARAARAYIALSGAAPGQLTSAGDLEALGASFDALAEVLGTPGPVSLPASRPRAPEGEVLKVGRST